MTVTIAIANAKGGVGKTTTAIHLALAYAAAGYAVLAVDVDHQGSLTEGLGVNIRKKPSLFEVLTEEAAVADAVYPVRRNLDVLGADIRFNPAEHKIGSLPYGELRLRRILRSLRQYDLVFIDCPPALGKVTASALAAADALLVPVEPSKHAIEGVDMMQQAREEVLEALDREVRFLGPVLCMAEHRASTKLTRRTLRERFGDLFFDAEIRRAEEIKQRAFLDQSVFDGDKLSGVAEDYLRLAGEMARRLGLLFAAGDIDGENAGTARHTAEA
jgi:chromosome partitioning protein